MRMSFYYKRAVLLICAVFCAAAFFFLQYRYDNKYSIPDVCGNEGIMDLRDGINTHPVNILTYGWEYYPQELLEPGTFDGHRPLYPYLGQYSGFEGQNGTGSPHGYATYRLNLLLPAKPDEYAMELPEIYSASKIWVNGCLVSSLGNVAGPFQQPVIRTGMVTFQAAGHAEIVVQAADYTHYYSGMVYPPAFGTMEAVSDLISFRLLRTCIMAISSFTIGIMYLMIGLKTGEERKQMILFALTSLLFCLHVIYPLFHLFGAGYWSYRLEDASFYLFLLAVTALHCSLCSISGKPRLAVLGISGFTVLLTLTAPSILMNHRLSAMMSYSVFLDSYKLLLFSWLIVTAFFNREHSERINILLLAGLCIIAVSLLFQAALPVFEPVRFGWQTENAGFVFILILGGGLWFETVKAYADRSVLAENLSLMKKQFSLQEANYQLITSNFEEIRQMRHDLRHHLNVIKELAAQGQYEELDHYIMGWEDSSEQAIRPTLCENQAVNAVLNYYQQVAVQKGIPLQLKVALPSKLKPESWNLGILFGNLLENAIEASEKVPEDMRMVKVYSKISNGNLLLTVRNHWAGELPLSGETVYSTKHEGAGIGLSSVRSLVKKNGGQFFLKPDKHEFEVSVVLWNAADKVKHIETGRNR
ncbi:sensor histidine kinase [Enterocloster aldenensis]|uniref:sensor histidine kinase n=1 Tax=Enterocloster aldenensis TaxID=358742 RepID=UPI0034A7DC7A